MDRAALLGTLWSRNARTIYAIGAAVSLSVAALCSGPGALARLDHAFLDGYLRHAANGRPAGDTLVVDIDDVSLSAVGQWPWPRYRVAALIQRIAAQKPAAIGLDVLFAEPDRSSLASIRETFRRDFAVDLAFSGVPDGLLDNDGFLGYTIAQAHVVGADYFYFDHFNRDARSVDPGVTIRGASGSTLSATGVLVNAAAIASQTRVSGFVNKQADDDGVLRRMPLLIEHRGVVHPSLALATAMQALGSATASIEADRDGAVVRVGTHRIPIDDAGFATPRFDGEPQHYRALSAVDVLNGDFDPAAVRDRIVFIGSSAVGLSDLHPTAVSSSFPGLKMQAVMAQDIVDDQFVTTPSWSTGVLVVECLAAGALMSLLFVAAGSVTVCVGGSVLLLSTLLLASVLAFARGGLFVPPSGPVVVVVLLFVLFFATRFAIERRRARLWQRQLENARQVTIESMASVAETRDPETGAHIKRTQHYVRAVAEQLQRTGHHTQLLTKDYIDLLFLSAPLHDIGKVGVPDHILLKPGRLTPEEFEVMKKHAEFGRKIIWSTAQRIEGDNFLIIAGEIAATHHERWDGTGYPLGLAGADIPLSGRIMAVADIYDALISRRCYKEPFSHELATKLMREAHGTIFDPAVLDAFFAIEATIEAIALRYGDEPEHADAAEPLPALRMVENPAGA